MKSIISKRNLGILLFGTPPIQNWQTQNYPIQNYFVILSMAPYSQKVLNRAVVDLSVLDRGCPYKSYPKSNVLISFNIQVLILVLF